MENGEMKMMMKEEPYFNRILDWVEMCEDSLANHENLSAASGAPAQLQVHSNSSDDHHHNSWKAAAISDPAPDSSESYNNNINLHLRNSFIPISDNDQHIGGPLSDEGLMTTPSASGRLPLCGNGTTGDKTSELMKSAHLHQMVSHSFSAHPKVAGKRRSRSFFSRKGLPGTTRILNANMDNFKDLVQQHTGCPTLPFGSIIGGSSSANKLKGPVMLCFDQATSHHQASIDYYDSKGRVVQDHVFVSGYGNCAASSDETK